MIDQGYGIRAKEADRVFAPFQRARQPQIIGEFGYGLSLYLAKAEVEAKANCGMRSACIILRTL